MIKEMSAHFQYKFWCDYYPRNMRRDFFNDYIKPVVGTNVASDINGFGWYVKSMEDIMLLKIALPTVQYYEVKY